jgi:hypothetical protein
MRGHLSNSHPIYMNPITDNISFDNAMALIKAGDAARATLHANIEAVFTHARQVAKERAADWQLISPKYGAVPNGVFAKHADITWTDEDDGNLSVSTFGQDAGGDPYGSQALFPTVWLWDVEVRRVGLHAELDRLKAIKETERQVKAQAQQDADRAQYEKLRAQFETPSQPST